MNKPAGLASTFCQELHSQCNVLIERYQLGLVIDVFAAPNLSKTISPEDIGNSFFWIKSTLKNARISVEICYGDREFEVSTKIRLRAGELFGLWEWNAALGLQESHNGAAMWVTDKKAVPTVVSRVVEALEYSLPPILKSDKAIYSRLCKLREQRYQEAFRSEQEAEYQKISALVAENFRSGNYSKTVELLEGLPVELSKSDAMKLTYSRKKLEQQNAA